MTGRRFWTLALVALLCVVVTAGCKRRRSSKTTINNTGSDIFTTDNFPGAPVQNGNVSDDKRAMSNAGEDYNGDLQCVHNGDTGVAMITYTTETGVYAHYYNGSTWTPPVHLNAVDADAISGDGSDVVVAFINTSEHADEDARDRDGDCLIFWCANDYDNDPTTTPDEVNYCLWVSYFDVSESGNAALNYGFDIDPSTPGFFYGQRVNDSYDDAGESVQTLALVTDGLCGEARWEDGDRSYSYGQQTTDIVIAWHQTDDKTVFDPTVAFSWFDLSQVDETFPIVPGTDLELAVQSIGGSDSGGTATETLVNQQLVSYNNFLFRRIDNEAAGTWGFFDLNSTGGFDGEDITLEHSFFNWTTVTVVTDNYNTVDGSCGALDATEMNSDFIHSNGFLGFAGRGTYGDDEGLSAVVTFFGEIVDGDLGTDVGTATYNVSLCVAELDITTGAFLNDAEDQFIDGEDSVILDDIDPDLVDTRISRNGDYIWVAWQELDDAGASDDLAVWACEFKTTRLDDDGNPVTIPALVDSLGGPILVSGDVDGIDTLWFMFQDNLGYICGHQSDAQEMNLFYMIYNSTVTQDDIWRVLLIADADGIVGSETAVTSLYLTEDDETYHDNYNGVNDSRTTFNVTDAGADGDLFAVWTAETGGGVGWTDNHFFAARTGVTAGSALEVDSQLIERQVRYDSRRLTLVATPPGEEIAQWNFDDAQYNSGAHFGPSYIHFFFQEAESMTAWENFGGTSTGRAVRTRVYRTDHSEPTFGANMSPSADAADFRPPFDLDIPFVDPTTTFDATRFQFAVCGNQVGTWFAELGHIYYQEFNPGNDDNDSVGWLTVDGFNGDPQLVDDDSPVEVDDTFDPIEEFCVRSCTCCDLTGAMIFWVKELDDDTGNERLQVRVRD